MANATLLLIQAARLDLSLEGLQKCANFVGAEIAIVIREKVKKAPMALLDDELSLFDKKCFAGEFAGMSMASTASGLEQTVRIDGLRHGRRRDRREQH